ncbi:tigger transposable element-derived protein 4-like [Aphis craccivora]|uniref:Tigger transposable element-derived protein 4-like n=1 Tax=Aphis craccivora TaxID=307492 RepID=A0A6G0YCL0_APHCR|nr:tigger transposable element-derived protein 4-like [Aphis craccivora]
MKLISRLKLFLASKADGNKDIEGIQLLTFYENEQVIEPEKALPNSVYILDDILTERQGVCRSIFARERHNVCYLAQSYSRVAKQLLRDNANLIVLFKQDETNLKHVYMEHCSGDMLYTEFKDFCTSCWRKGRVNFIVINKDCERDNGRYRYGFDTFVII